MFSKQHTYASFINIPLRFAAFGEDEGIDRRRSPEKTKTKRQREQIQVKSSDKNKYYVYYCYAVRISIQIAPVYLRFVLPAAHGSFIVMCVNDIATFRWNQTITA